MKRCVRSARIEGETMNETWWHDEELLTAKPELKKDLINTLIGMRAVFDLENDTGVRLAISPEKEKELAISYLKGLHKSAIHAYMKRLCDLEEYRLPETLIAILQYEFQANMMLEKTKVPISVKRYVEYVSWLIGSFRKRWGIEPFDDTGLKLGWQLYCEACNRWIFSDNMNEKCDICGKEAELNEICTIPYGCEFKGGKIAGNASFAPSNGSEDKAIASVKKLLGVKP